MRLRALARKNPVEWTRSSSSSGLATARSDAVGYRANTAGTTLLTISSVHCAERIVAISSSNGVSCTSSHSSGALPGYSSARRSRTTSARALAPRGARASLGTAAFFVAVFFAGVATEPTLPSAPWPTSEH